MSNTEYVCALSGTEAPDDLLVDVDEDDDLGDLPVGWLEITIKRRVLNPMWEEIQGVKETMMAAQLGTVPEEQRTNPEAIRFVTISVDAQFAALEERTDQYLTIEDVVYVSDPDGDAKVAEALRDVLETLDVDAEGLVPPAEKPEPAAKPKK